MTESTHQDRDEQQGDSPARLLVGSLTLGLVTAEPALGLNVLSPYDSFEVQRFLYAIVLTAATAILTTGLLWKLSHRKLSEVLPLSAAIVLCLFHWPLFTGAGQWAASFAGTWLGAGVVPVALAALFLFVCVRLAADRWLVVAMLVAALAVTAAPLFGTLTRVFGSSEPLPVPPSVDVAIYQPDVFFIVLDMYAGNDVLLDYFNFDNAAIVRTLEEAGFVIPDRTRAVYSSTPASLGSIFAMEYLLEPGDVEPREIQMVRNATGGAGPVVETFKSAGYRFTYLESPWGVSACGREVDECFRYWSLSETAAWLLELTIFAPLTDAGNYVASPRMALSHFQELEELAAQRSSTPRFVYAHIGIPHPPLLLDATCQLGDYSKSGAAFGRWTKPAYIEQLQCVNRLIDSLVGVIVEENPEAVVILTGDHGTQSLGQRDKPAGQWTTSDADEALSVFSAHRLPARCRDTVGSELELVSTFRVVINCVFGTDLPLLSGRYYFASPPHVQSPSVSELAVPTD